MSERIRSSISAAGRRAPARPCHLRDGRRPRRRDVSRHPQGPAGRWRRSHRIRDAVHRPDGRRPRDPGGGLESAEERADFARDAEDGQSLPRRERRHADHPDGLFQSHLLLRRRAVPRRRQGRWGRRPHRGRPSAEEDDGSACRRCRAGLAFIRLATPTTDDARLPTVLTNTSGFVYYVSITGVTGSATPDPNAVGKAVARIKRHTSLPVAVGFGVRDAASAARSARRPTASSWDPPWSKRCEARSPTEARAQRP